MSFLRQTQ